MEEGMDGFIVARKNGTLHCVSVDQADFNRIISEGSWYVRQDGRTWYAMRESDGKTVLLHRFICGLGHGDPLQVDHIDGNGLNNCRTNLRIVTHVQQHQNRQPRVGASSKFRGVSWHKAVGKWCSEVKCGSVRRYLGAFSSELEAARAAAEARALIFTHTVESRHPTD